MKRKTVSLFLLSSLTVLCSTSDASTEETAEMISSLNMTVRSSAVAPSGGNRLSTVMPLNFIVPVAAIPSQVYSLNMTSSTHAPPPGAQWRVTWMAAKKVPDQQLVCITRELSSSSDLVSATWQPKASDFNDEGRALLIAQFKLVRGDMVVERGERAFEVHKYEIPPLPAETFVVPARAMPGQPCALAANFTDPRPKPNPGDRWQIEWAKGVRDHTSGMAYMTGVISNDANATWTPEHADFAVSGSAVVFANYRLYDAQDNIVLRGLHTFDVALIEPPPPSDDGHALLTA